MLGIPLGNLLAPIFSSLGSVVGTLSIVCVGFSVFDCVGHSVCFLAGAIVGSFVTSCDGLFVFVKLGCELI